MRTTAVVVIDEAHRLPAGVIEQLVALALPEAGRELALQIVLLGQTPAHSPLLLGQRPGRAHRDQRPAGPAHARRMRTRTCAIASRVAGADAAQIFSTRALDVLFGLSDGLPRL